MQFTVFILASIFALSNVAPSYAACGGADNPQHTLYFYEKTNDWDNVGPCYGADIPGNNTCVALPAGTIPTPAEKIRMPIGEWLCYLHRDNSCGGESLCQWGSGPLPEDWQGNIGSVFCTLPNEMNWPPCGGA